MIEERTLIDFPLSRSPDPLSEDFVEESRCSIPMTLALNPLIIMMGMATTKSDRSTIIEEYKELEGTSSAEIVRDVFLEYLRKVA